MEPFSIEPTVSPPLTFSEHLKALPKHKSVLVQHYKLLAGPPKEVCRLVMDMSKAYLVSNGGTATDYRSYGWVLGLDDSTQLAHQWGQVFGHNPKSYQAEALGQRLEAGAIFLWENCLNTANILSLPLAASIFSAIMKDF
jgi:hypothetical protein